MMSQDQPIETLKSLKKELKQWEHQFQNEYGRKPEKKDIAQIPDIAKKYKLYSKLKSSGTQEEEKVDSAIVTTPGVKATIIDKKELQMNLTKMSEEEVPRKANVRSTLWSGPVATDQVGTNTNRFQQRLTQQKSVEQLEENLKSLNVQPLQALETSQTDVEIQGFFHRRMEIDAFSQEKLQSMRQSIQSLTSPVVQALPTQLIQVQSQSPSLDEKPPAAVLQKPIDLPQPDIIAVKPVAKSSWTEPPESQQTEPKEPKSERSSRSSRRYSKKDTPVIEPPSPVAVAQLPDPKQEEPETPKELESQAAVKEQEKVEETVKEQEKLDEAAKEQEEPRVSRNSPGEVNKLPSIVPGNLFARVDDGGVLRCKLYRKKNLLEVNFPTYMLHNEADNKFMFSAKKRIMSKTPNYIVSDSPGDISKDSIHYVGKIKGNFKRSNFIISDTRNPSKPQEVALVNYSKNVLPRELQVAMPAVHLKDYQDYTTDITYDFKIRNMEKVMLLKNKPPRWNEATQSHCLNFGGRVTQPSIKNMQLIAETDFGDDATILLQFGRCGPDFFTLDVRWPLTPFEAFCIAITTFEADDSN